MDYPEVHEMSNLKIGLLKTNVPPCQDGISKAAFSPVFRADVLEVRYARTTGCGLAEWAFLNSPDAFRHPTCLWAYLLVKK